jgi:hypothetical protein
LDEYLGRFHDGNRLELLRRGKGLWAGVRGEDEERSLRQFTRAFQIVPVDEPVAVRGGTFRRIYGASHGTGLAAPYER